MTSNTQTLKHPDWCTPACCQIDPGDGAALHESFPIKIGPHTLSIVQPADDPTRIQLDDETLSLREAQQRADDLEKLASELRRHVNDASSGAPGPINTGA